ncbi:Transposon Tf2-6 polyprotein [Dictyocoela muelleri]|nr:Transposon Tf2-6 polyprotein [Dictyocoela muelleri]
MVSIFKSLNHFKRLLLGSKITVYTDHANLIHENNISNRINKWKIALMDFNYTLKYIKGSENIIADKLSRLNKLSYSSSITNEIEKAQKDIKMKENYKKIKFKEFYLLKDKNDRIIIPTSIISNFLLKMHLKLNHPSTFLLYNSLKKYYYVANFINELKEISFKCEFCQKYKNHKISHDFTQNIETPKAIFEKISSDIYVPFSLDDNECKIVSKNNYILTFTDNCPRYTNVFYLPKITTIEVMKCFKEWFKKFKIPKYIITDNGRQFVSKKMSTFLFKNKIIHIKTSPYNPQSNGISERIYQTITRIINSNKNEKISTIIKKINFTLINSYNRMIGCSPIEIIREYSELDLLRRNYKINLEEIIRRSDINKNKSVKYKNKNKRKYSFKIGDKIFIKVKETSKDSLKWIGPFEISKLKPNYLYVHEREAPINFRNVRPWRRR